MTKKWCRIFYNRFLKQPMKILTRFRPISSANDFTNTMEGMEKLDAICMLIIALGESLKNIDKITGGKLLSKYPEVDWKGNLLVSSIENQHSSFSIT